MIKSEELTLENKLFFKYLPTFGYPKSSLIMKINTINLQ